jgi:hypothetical protein
LPRWTRLAVDGATPSVPELEGFQFDRPILLGTDPVPRLAI